MQNNGNQIRIIFCDLDDCLLNSEKQIPESFAGVMQELERRNISFVAATGRQNQNAKSLFRFYPKELDYLTHNGSLAEHQGKIVYQAEFTRKEVMHIAETVRSAKGTAVSLSCLQDSCCEPADMKILKSVMRNGALHFKEIEHLAENTDPVMQISVYDPLLHSDRGMKPYQCLMNEFEVRNGTGNWVDINPRNVNKGRTAKRMMDILNIPADQAMAFGDSYTDIEMLQEVKYGYALLNAPEDVKQKVQRVTEFDCNHNGVMHQIEKYLKGEQYG